MVTNKDLDRLPKTLIYTVIRPPHPLRGAAKSRKLFVAKEGSGSLHDRVGKKDG